MLDVYQRLLGELREQQDEIGDPLRGDVPRVHGLLMRQPDSDLSEVRFRDDRLQMVRQLVGKSAAAWLRSCQRR